ncbi:MAG: DNA repair protein RadA [Gammaproteobacteria bacterium]|nr:DNA repair protein RadA [Gammaproteobacteria bacterium]
MSKAKRIFTCNDCGAQHLKWQGQCPDCGSWNALTESRESTGRRAVQGASRPAPVATTRLDEISVADIARMPSGLSELDRVLGGGLVPGSVVLIGGDPGIGKSTLLLGAAARLSGTQRVCYVTGEESLDQIGLRAARLEVADAPVELLAETCVEAVIDQLEQAPPGVLVIDSIQTLFSEQLESAPGSVSQLRESAAQLVRFAKRHGVATLLVGHVTKEGTLAGPRVLEHMVDTVLYFETDLGSRFRIMRAVKNRFGAANEMGFFVMGAQGFKEVKNPSAIFLARRSEPVAGSVTLVTRESSRPLLVEVQALVDSTPGGPPRRLAQGLDVQRLGLLLAVAHRHCNLGVGDHDVFANVVGGMRIGETAADLAVLLAVVSSLADIAIPSDLVVFGEIGLTGEIRPVPFGEERLLEAHKHGFARALIPAANAPREEAAGMEVIAVSRIGEALSRVGLG